MGSPRSTRRPAFNGRRLGMLAAAVVMCCWLSGLRREAASAKRQATTAAVGGAGGGPEQLAAQSLADAKPAAAASLRTATKKASLALDGAAAAREALAAAAAAAAEAAIAIEQRKSRTQGQPAARVVEDAEVVAGQVLAGAGVHGFVEKTGSLDPQAWQTVHKRWRAKRLHAWESQRGAALAAGAPPPPLPLTSTCQVWVNHQYRVLYVRHAKTGSSSILCHFSGCKEQREGGAPPLNTSFVPLTGVAGVELEELWQNYLVITFVRNTWQRAVSSYRMMARQLTPAGARSFTWDTFCADPAGFVKRCMADPRCAPRTPSFVYTHIQPQQACLLAGDGGWAVDFIGRTEHIDEDLNAVLQEVEKRRPADVPPLPPLAKSLDNVNGRGCNETAQGGRSAAQEQYCDQAAYYTGRHEACFELVRHHYTQDVATLKFGAADDAETEAAAAAAEAAAEAEAAVEDAAAEQRH